MSTKRDKSNNGYLIKLITSVLIVLFAILPFHYVNCNSKFFIIPKDNFTFNKTFVSDMDVENMIKRYNEGNFFEQVALGNKYLYMKLVEKGVIVKKGISNEIPDIISPLDFLNNFDGKYPIPAELFEIPLLKERLESMLDSEYSFMISIWETESPIEISNGLFYAWGMKAHSGGDPSAVIMADIKKNVLFVGIKQDGYVKLSSEDGSKAPQKLIDWSNE